MTTFTRSWWRSPEFESFVPYIKATAAWDKRHGNHPRFDLKSNTPFGIERDALNYRASCVACGAPMAPFRQRKGASGVYLAVACEQDRNNACSRGRYASDAYDRIWQLVREQPGDGDQGALL